MLNQNKGIMLSQLILLILIFQINLGTYSFNNLRPAYNNPV